MSLDDRIGVRMLIECQYYLRRKSWIFVKKKKKFSFDFQSNEKTREYIIHNVCNIDTFQRSRTERVNVVVFKIERFHYPRRKVKVTK